MRQFSLVGAHEKIKEAFSFLIHNGFQLVIDEDKNYGSTLEYKKNDVRVHLFYDYRDNQFFFDLVKGETTKVPNDYDYENIKRFGTLFEKYEQAFHYKSLQPDDEGYIDALNANAEKLKKYGHTVLNGQEWV